MEKSEYFSSEINLIKDSDYREFAHWFFNNCVGEWFWKSGASSSGKYHPLFARNSGGLVRHTKAVVLICEELLRLEEYATMPEQYKDYATLACLFHDTRKYGGADVEDKECYSQHGLLAADAVGMAWFDYFDEPCPELLTLAIKSHMGQWTENAADRPITKIDRLVHLADYIASRSFFDIPQISKEYELCEEREICEMPIDFFPF